MTTLETYFVVFLGIQLVHSIEELATGFHRKFPPFKMTFRFFLLWEVGFFLFWVLILLLNAFPAREYFMALFIILMFANGIWHTIWFLFFEKGKTYVPGLATAQFFIIVFLLFYYSMLF